MKPTTVREEAWSRVAELVKRFKRNETDHLHTTYNETQTRTEFITPLLEAFGWDVPNKAGLPLAYREVIEEATVEVGEERVAKKPDYELRLARQRKIFVEAKKPSVHIDRDRSPAFQTRRYGYSASLPISIVTNFHQLAIYDCHQLPLETDEAHIARIMLVQYNDYESSFDELWGLLSREAIYSGAFDRRFNVATTRRGADQFDDYFLRQVQDWRKRLAIDIWANTPDLSVEELTYSVQLFLSRIVFLRICEDREIEKYETLKNLDTSAVFDGLMTILRRADEFYDSGLFALLDDKRLGIRISDATLANIVRELYYPNSPYTFSVVQTEVLGEIYEQFLGEVITVQDGAVTIVDSPEVRVSGGVVPTPSFIADRIVKQTMDASLSGKSPAELNGFTVADICCGSGIFLLSAYEYLLDHYLKWYLSDGSANYSGRRIYDAGAGLWRLTFEEKRRILLLHLRGIDIDPNAVELTQFSLLLKLIEDESVDSLKEYVKAQKQPALPSLCDTIRCGNSLVDAAEWKIACGVMSVDLRRKVNPFTWAEEFPEEMTVGGFSVIVGNPPYVRIQNMVAYSKEEVAYYKHNASPYKTAHQDNFDKYALFIERSLALVHGNGQIGVIVPHKFMTIQAGRALRTLLTDPLIIENITHFGAKQVFGRDTSNYTCILVLNRAGTGTVRFERTGPLEAWRYGKKGQVTYLNAGEISQDPWQLADQEVSDLFDRIRNRCPVQLLDLAEITVGVQTSADGIFIGREIISDTNTITCQWNGRAWQIEKNIVRPCIHDVKLCAFGHPVPNAWIIFPYELVEDINGRIRARLFQPDVMADRYPLCWEYLSSRRQELEKRNIVGGRADERQWYQYGRSQSLTKFDQPKIIFPVLSVEPRYAYDAPNTLFTGGGNGPYYMVRARDDTNISTFFLLAVLNHPLSEALVRTSTSTFRGGYYSHGRQFIKNIPIPVPTEAQGIAIETKTRELIEVVDEYKTSRIPSARARKKRVVTDLRKEVEDLVSECFGLSDADMDIVKSVPIPA